MGSNNDKSRSETDELRRRATDRLRVRAPKERSSWEENDRQRLVHELEVHQIELEMQNEQLRQSRDDMEETLEKFTDLYDFAPVGYATIDRDGIVRAANLTGAGLLGIERSRLTGRHFSQFVAAEAHSLFSEFLGKVFARPGKESCEVTLSTKGSLPLIVQIDAMVSASGQECRIAIIDISKRRQLEEQLEILHDDLAARAAELAAANIELEAFNFTVSHDLRKPLSIIHGYCQLVQELCREQLDEQSKEFIQEIYEGTKSMNRLITSLLRFSRATRTEMRRETVDMSAMAKAVASELQLAEPERRVSFRIAEGITGNGDEGLWRIVLDNLIGNAWKYSANREEAVIEFDMKEVDGKPACFVRDNGPGFDMAHADKLYIPFQRIPGIDVEGHGIGLATVERIVRRHGGRIWAESEPGKGATFFFTME
ncbi:sensor histidine kinase [Geobacter argillaceus]|uniref:histidine kinase n=1 Tax=Geobacter argillaceus TaxID=345631 RepID=A0A562V8T9_9BACT|nr:ATP-binding protein [Geobacter argillaceus]TWJ14316.1 PAS domain S-box-containing protein [Geobacter argillaceus]